MNIIHLAETDSTNRYLYAMFAEGDVPDFTTISTDFQTAGRGQRGNTWNAERGVNLLFSVAINPTFVHAKEQFIVSQAVALAIKEVLSGYADGFSIKWPNDIYWNDRKIAGILIENVLEGSHIAHCVVGVGLNVNQSSFDANIPNPVSLRGIVGAEVDREALLEAIVARMAYRYDEIKRQSTDDIVAGYLSSLFRREGYHRYRDARGEFDAKITAIDSDGRITLTDSEGIARGYLFKEVEYVL